ncbi:MFS transporter [Microbulbifer echini]|uniref:MFS transporter n=1 Tax=Microbulbifer echini TaxID=1529067 RepID=A0ABV4NMJ9_9GAMM|nr:MFS transporter [uncultured Microbulbifer sp.]
MESTRGSLSALHYWGLFVLLLAVFLVCNDFSAFSTSIVSVEGSFSVGIAVGHWLVNTYVLVFGVLIVTSGNLADIYGRKRIFLIGIAVIAVFSLLGGMAEKVWLLLLSRAFIGVGGALAWASILGMAYSLMPKERAGQTGGLILAVTGLASAFGPVIGGVFSDYLSWRWILFSNIPLSILIMIICWSKYPSDNVNRPSKGIDYLGVLTLSVALFCFLLAMDEIEQIGFWNNIIASLLALSFVFLSAFVLIEFWTKDNALMPVRLLVNRSFMASALSMLFVAVAFFSTLFYIPQLFIKVHGYTSLQAGFALLPLMAASGVFALISGVLHEKLGAKILICGGALGMCAGLFMLSDLEGEVNYVAYLPGLLLVGTSIGVYSPAIITAAITAVTPGESSRTGSIIYMFKYIGGALGLGVNATILAISPDIATGIFRIFSVDAFLCLIGFSVSILFISNDSVRSFRV